MADKSFLRGQSNQELEDARQARIAAEKQAQKPEALKLAGYIHNCFEEAQNHKNKDITPRLLACQRQRLGQYDPDKLKEIQSRGGCQDFFNITATKCAAFEAWLMDIMGSTQEAPWALAPTPVPELPEDMGQQVVEQTVRHFQTSLSQEITPADVQQYTLDLNDQILKQVHDEAKKRCERMEQKISDQLEEGGWRQAISFFIQDLSTYPLAILKGPVIRKDRRMKWQDGQLVITDVEIPTWSCVSPFDIFPAPNCRNVQHSYICELMRFDPVQLSKMRGVDGWNTNMIDLTLREYQSKKPITSTISGDSERETLEGQDTSGVFNYNIEAIQFWGSVAGEMLREWGVKPPKGKTFEDTDFYEITAVLCLGKYVVQAILNPDPLNRRPYSITGFMKVSGSLWCRALPEEMADCQNGYTACLRNMVDNLAMAGGFQVVVDVDAVPPENSVTDVYPGKVWQWHSNEVVGRSGSPVQFEQPQSFTDKYLSAAEYFAQQSDDRTLVPRFAHANADMGGAAQTATGLSMLMTAGGRNIKRVIGSMDEDVIRTAIQRQYAWNLRYLSDASIKGDVIVMPRGIVAALVREQTQLRRQEFLSTTLNQTDLFIIGMEGRRKILREVATGLNMDVDEIIPSEEELRARVEQQLAAAIPAEMQEEGKPPNE